MYVKDCFMTNSFGLEVTVKKVRGYMTLLLATCFALSMTSAVMATEKDVGNDAGIRPQLAMYEFIRYDHNAHSVNDAGRHIGSVSGDNRSGSTPMVISFKYATTDSVTASFSSTLGGEVGVEAILSKVKTSLNFTVELERKWTKGMESGVSASIDPYSAQIISGYIPLVSTSGSYILRTYNDSTPNQTQIITVPVKGLNIPATDRIHFVKQNYNPTYG